MNDNCGVATSRVVLSASLLCSIQFPSSIDVYMYVGVHVGRVYGTSREGVCLGCPFWRLVVKIADLVLHLLNGQVVLLGKGHFRNGHVDSLLEYFKGHQGDDNGLSCAVHCPKDTLNSPSGRLVTYHSVPVTIVRNLGMPLRIKRLNTQA